MVGGFQRSRLAVPLGKSEIVSIFSLRAELSSHSVCENGIINKQVEI